MAEGAEPADAEPVASCFGIFGGGKKSAIIATQQETIRRLSANKAQLDKVLDEVIAHGKEVENERNRLISKIESYESQMKEMNEQVSMSSEMIAYERVEKEAAKNHALELEIRLTEMERATDVAQASQREEIEQLTDEVLYIAITRPLEYSELH
jgi:phage-related tail protein